MVDNRWGWFIMELPALLTCPLIAIFGPVEKSLVAWLAIGLWILHYGNRVLIFPFRLKTQGKKMPISIVLSAMAFNLINGFVNGYYLGFLGHANSNLLALNLWVGILVFFAGRYINMKADKKLIALREEGDGYKIPQGWLFQYISCPNHFGEVIEWVGYAIAFWNLPALSFAIWTFCNLGPRAQNHHAWYKEFFTDYPKNRKAIIPFIW